MNEENLIDLELIKRFKEGERSAFDQLFKRYKEKIVHVAMRYTGGNLQASEDIAHEVFIEVYQNIHKFRGEGRFFAYLYGITFYKAKEYLRAQRNKREVPLFPEEGEEKEETIASSGESPRHIHDKKELQKILQKALDQLPDTGRQVFILTQIEEYSYEETADTLGIARGTVGAHLYQARKKLRELLPLHLLDVFLFSMWRYVRGSLISMNLIVENIKLALGQTSPVLLSFYADGETSEWQSRKLRALLKNEPRFSEMHQDFKKINVLYHALDKPVLAADFDIRFERKLLGRTEERKINWLALPKPALSLLTSLALIAGITFSLPYIQQPDLSVSNWSGKVEIYDGKTGSWSELKDRVRIRKNTRLKIADNSSVDLALKGIFHIRLKENSEIEWKQLVRRWQKGEFILTQNEGAALISLGEKFKGSQLTVTTPYAHVHAFGTQFSINIDRPQDRMRVMVLEGTVQVENLSKEDRQPIPPQTERTITKTDIGEARPLAPEREREINELLKLPNFGKSKVSGFLEENLSLMLIPGPTRTQDFLDNPRIFTKQEYPLLTEKIISVRQVIKEASAEKRQEAYNSIIQELRHFSNAYLDPYGRFKPHIDAFTGALYYTLGSYEQSLDVFSNLTQQSEKEWKGIGHLARGIIFSEKLNRPREATQEFEKTISESPDSPEGLEAQNRLKGLKTS